MADLVYGSLITEIGSKKLVEAAKNGTKIDVVKFQVGDGGGKYYLPTKDQTSLKNKLYEDNITSYAIDPDDETALIIKCEMPSDGSVFTIREWGLIDSDGDLIAISNISEIEFATLQTGEILNMRLEIYLQFDNYEIGGINVIVEPSAEEFLRQDVYRRVDYLLSKIQEIPGERIDEIVASVRGGKPLGVYGTPLSQEVLDRILDDDPSNDPPYDGSLDAIGGPVLDSIFNADIEED